MLKKSFLLSILAFSLILTACTRHHVVNAPSPFPLSAHQQSRNVPLFNRIKVEGPFNVMLHTGFARPQVILRGDPRDLAYITTAVVNNTLLLTIGKGYPHFGAIHADIRGRYLNSFVYNGTGVITGTKLRSSLLDLTIANEGRTTLQGNIALRNLTVDGGGFLQIDGVTSENLRVKVTGKPRIKLSGTVNLTSLDIDSGAWLSLQWIKSNALTVRARGTSFIQLAGIVNRLDVELWDKACFKGRYLRSNISFVKTHGQSVAEISTITKQHSLATDASDIHFFYIPKMRTDFMAFNGSVLDLRDWNNPFMQEYDRYNK